MANKIFVLCSMILISFLMVDFTLSYVVCPDEISACGDREICCKRGSGFRCCPATLCCCEEGTYCCKCTSNVKEFMKVLLEMPSEPSHILVSSYNQSNISEIKELSEINVNGALELLNSFLNTTGFYKYSNITLLCQEEFSEVMSEFSSTLDLLQNQTLIENKTEFFTELFSHLSELFKHARQSVLECKNVSENLKIVFNMIYGTITNKNFFDNIRANFPFVLSQLQEIKLELSTQQYQKCGETLGNLFIKLFSV